jgi:hypothetical protein
MTRTESPLVSIPRQTVPANRRRAAAATVVRLESEYDPSTVGRLWETLARAISYDGADLVIADLEAASHAPNVACRGGP